MQGANVAQMMLCGDKTRFRGPCVITPQPVENVVQVDGLRIHYLEWGSPVVQPLIPLYGIARVARIITIRMRLLASCALPIPG